MLRGQTGRGNYDFLTFANLCGKWALKVKNQLIRTHF